MAQAKVTVVMPVYDGEPHLREAIDSILGQTYRDLELLVLDDGSRDASAEIVSSYRDPRVQLHRNPRNLGLSATINAGLELARGAYLARMDADDVALPQRIERQVRYLDAHPRVAVLGTGVRNFGTVSSGWTIKSRPEEVRARLVFECPLCHPTVMLRPDVLRRLGLRYDGTYAHAEDYALWSALAEHAELANLPERLLRYRTHADQVSSRHAAVQLESTRRIRERELARLGVAASPAELRLHEQIVAGEPAPAPEWLDRAEAWLRRLAAAGESLPERRAAAHRAEIAYRWARVCRRSRRLGLEAWRRFRASPLHAGAPVLSSAEVALGALSGAARARRRAAVVGERAACPVEAVDGSRRSGPG